MWSIALEKQFDNVIAFEPSTKNLECLRPNWDGEIREFVARDVNSTVVFKDSAKNCGNGKVRLDPTTEGSHMKLKWLNLTIKILLIVV